MDTKFMADTKIADSSRQYQMMKASFDMEVNAKVGTWVIVLKPVMFVEKFHSDVNEVSIL